MSSSCPWGSTSSTDREVSSLADVMSEQMASDLKTKQEERDEKALSEAIRASHRQEDEELKRAIEESLLDGGGGGAEASESAEVETENQLENDLMIAQLLQMQFDREQDAFIDNAQAAVNGNAKVTLSFRNYKSVPENSFWDQDDEDDVDRELEQYLSMDDRKRDWDAYETADKTAGAMPRCGYKKTNEGSFITKHDNAMNQRANGKRMMAIPHEISTGDGGGIDVGLSNRVFNNLKKFAAKEGRRKDAKVQDKSDKSTAEGAVDPATKLVLFKMINNGVLDGVNGVVSTGKEAVIIHADGGPGPEEGQGPSNIPAECIVKVFKTTLNEFKTREKYIKDDYRFRKRFSKQNPRKIIHMWAEKEMRNLVKMGRCGINVPEAVMLKKHVLLMSFVGRDRVPAPKLKDVEFSSESDLRRAYKEVVVTMHDLYKKCHLVHADLSEYNILWHDDKPFFIDVSQSVEPNHPHGLEWLYRDCLNVTNFFQKRGLEVESPWALFTDITGLPLGDDGTPGSEAAILAKILDFEKREEILSLGAGFRNEIGEDLNDEEELIVNHGGDLYSHRHYPFDYCWEKAKSITPVDIPGHKSRGGSSRKATPSTIIAAAKSPSASKSPSAKKSLAGMTDKELQDLKNEMLDDKSEG